MQHRIGSFSMAYRPARLVLAFLGYNGQMRRMFCVLLMAAIAGVLSACQDQQGREPEIASQSAVLAAKDLQKLGTEACRNNRVLTVVITRQDCPYCDKLKKQVLLPDLRNGVFNKQWLLAELRIDEGINVRDFSGKTVAAAELAKRWRAELTPTVLFLNQKGEEIAPRITGLKLVDFYDDYLQKSLRQGLENPQRCS